MIQTIAMLFAYTVVGTCALLSAWLVYGWFTVKREPTKIKRCAVIDVRVLQLIFMADWKGGSEACPEDARELVRI